MSSQECRATPTTNQPYPLDARFTVEEKALLSRVRKRVESHPNQFDFVGNERLGLHFARWLVQHGKFAEE